MDPSADARGHGAGQQSATDKKSLVASTQGTQQMIIQRIDSYGTMAERSDRHIIQGTHFLGTCYKSQQVAFEDVVVVVYDGARKFPDGGGGSYHEVADDDVGDDADSVEVGLDGRQ